jgi:hypothetical protein
MLLNSKRRNWGMHQEGKRCTQDQATVQLWTANQPAGYSSHSEISAGAFVAKPSPQP